MKNEGSLQTTYSTRRFDVKRNEALSGSILSGLSRRVWVLISGETDQAAPLLRTLDASPLFVSSEFNTAPMRIQASDTRRPGEAFRVRTNREGAALAGGRP